MLSKYFAFVLLLFCLSNCNPKDEESIVPSLGIEITDSRYAQTPNLWIDQEKLHLTWTEEKEDTTSLYYAYLDDLTLVKSKVASGADWFVNWADFSSITSSTAQSKRFMTHWLEKSNEGTYDYDVVVSLSKDYGQTWSSGKVLHDDGIAAEHGFVSVSPYDNDHFFASWLDGRNTKTKDPKVDGKNLPMSLRAGLISNTDLSVREYPLDLKVCDCCQTSTVKSQDGILIAYRDRTDEEIRDITIQKFDPDGSNIIFQSNDNWKINGCPVNGPALSSDGDWDALSWYTAADSAGVYMAYGKNASFDKKIKIDNGNPLGRVDIEIADNKAYVSWLEMSNQRAEIRLKTIDLITESIIDDQLISFTSPERRSGFPILKLSNEHAYITFTEVLSADHTTIRLKQIKI